MMNYKRKVLSIIMIFIMIFGMFTTSYAAPSSWAEDFVKSMLLEELSSDELLDPDQLQKPITREEFAELTVRLYAKATDMKVDDIVQWNPFADTDNKMVAKAYNIGIVSGTGVDSRDRKVFTPGKLVTRQEIAIMLVKELNVLGKHSEAKYNQKFTDDSDIASWAYEAVAIASETGILSGTGGNKVSPLSHATREQALVLINKIAVKYGWTENVHTSSRFSYANATKSNGFWLPIYTASQLRASNTSTGVKFVSSYLIDSYTPDILKQQEDLINILVNSDKVNYNTLLITRTLINSSYDHISKEYKTSDTVYIDINTGSTSQIAPSAPYFKFTVDTEMTLEYVK